MKIAYLVFTGALAAFASAPAVSGTVCDLHFDQGQVLRSIPVAQTKDEQSKGLSGSVSVEPGLLFTWPDEDARVFWMKDTAMNLSIGFINDNGDVFSIQDMHAMTEKFHFSGAPASAALELPQGDFDRLGIFVGSKLVKKDCLEQNIRK